MLHVKFQYIGLNNGKSLRGQTVLFQTRPWECYSVWYLQMLHIKFGFDWPSVGLTTRVSPTTRPIPETRPKNLTSSHKRTDLSDVTLHQTKLTSPQVHYSNNNGCLRVFRDHSTAFQLIMSLFVRL